MSSVSPAWQFDERSAAGVDYQNVDLARKYDARHQRFRDYRKDARGIVERLGLGPDSTVIDMGAGTGAFAVPAAEICKRIYAVDVSGAMLDVCREKARAAGLDNVVCRQGGFLTYEHPDPPVDAIVSVAALHHLPDFWKAMAMRRCADLLRPGGRLFLFDIVFPSAIEDLESRLDAWIRAVAEKAGAEMAAEAETHVRSEFSTCDWIMEGILERAGFAIESAKYAEGFQATYLCVRKP